MENEAKIEALTIRQSNLNKNNDEQKLKEEVQNEKKQELFESQNKLIPQIPIKEVYEHFQILTTTTNKFCFGILPSTLTSFGSLP